MSSNGTAAAGFVQGRPVTQAPIENTGESAPKRAGASARARTPGQAKPSTRSLETQIGATLFVMNMMAMSVPKLREDALDSNEITALAKAIDLQCKTSPRFRKYVEGALSAGSGAGLLGVCVMIGARRAARHDLIPRDFDGAFGSLIAGTIGSKPTPVEA